MYVKLFDTILRSTVWMLPAPHVKVWLTFLLIADSDGMVRCSVPGLAKEAGVTLDECRAAIATLEAPDPDSQSKDEGGRRLLRVGDGEPVWFVVNYAHYRNLRDTGARQEYMRTYMKRYRQREKGVNPGVNFVNNGKQALAQAEAEAEAEAEADTKTRGGAGAPDSRVCQEVVDLWNATRRLGMPAVRELTSSRRRTIRARLKEHTPEELAAVFARVARSTFLTGGCPGKDGAAPFVASFDWTMKPSNMAKVIEGNYDDRKPRKPRDPGALDGVYACPICNKSGLTHDGLTQHWSHDHSDQEREEYDQARVKGGKQ